ncbi:DNA translocase FtsK [Lactobacillus selangorensis]|nr:DNA translocase FtsK [Lactobacillus selangorensis]
MDEHYDGPAFYRQNERQPQQAASQAQRPVRSASAAQVSQAPASVASSSEEEPLDAALPHVRQEAKREHLARHLGTNEEWHWQVPLDEYKHILEELHKTPDEYYLFGSLEDEEPNVAPIENTASATILFSPEESSVAAADSEVVSSAAETGESTVAPTSAAPAIVSEAVPEETATSSEPESVADTTTEIKSEEPVAEDRTAVMTTEAPSEDSIEATTEATVQRIPATVSEFYGNLHQQRLTPNSLAEKKPVQSQQLSYKARKKLLKQQRQLRRSLAEEKSSAASAVTETETTTAPTEETTVEITSAPTTAITSAPTTAATSVPTEEATMAPTQVPTVAVTVAPTAMPTEEATSIPTQVAVAAPTTAPTQAPVTVSTTAEAAPVIDTAVAAAYQMPPLSLLPAPVIPDESEMQTWAQDQAQTLDETLEAFHVKAHVTHWTTGPAVTQFEVALDRGVKVNKITNLNDDLKLALAAKDIRIEAPIPGKRTVGIEIPNLKSRPVMLSEVMRSPEFQNSKSPLTVALGVNLFGKPMVTDINKMPHGLIAGATGSGKSVFINSVIVSLLYKAKPNEVKLLLIDPKEVELAPYNGLPHLLSPVISDPQAAAAALKWAVNEMDNRYKKLAAAGVRNIKQFNEKARANGDDGLIMPYIVIIIDELADLMMVASSEVQDYIARITQKARAAGLHLLVATQRPSVDVITGTIKNNIPTRIAFMVSSQVDSRTIIDQSGAERLLGRGDMLYLGNGQSQPVRIQGTYVENEVDQIVSYVKNQQGPHYAFNPDSLLKKVTQTENEDELWPDVLDYIAGEKGVSTSKLQRVFSIGYNRAAKLIDDLETRHYISGSNGSKPREVFYTGNSETNE